MRLWICAAIALLPLAGQTAEEHGDKAAEFLQAGDLKSAEAELRKAVELAPNDPALLTSLGGVLGREGHAREANTYLARAVQIDGNDPLLRRNLAANEWQLGEFDKAKSNLELLLRVNPRDGTAIFLLGMVSEGLHDYARCISLLASLPDVTTRKPEAAVALADAYYHTGETPKARSALQSISNARLALAGGKIAIDARDYSTALALFSAFAGEPEVLIAKASLQSALRFYTDAAATWKRAVEAKPDSAEARAGLAVAEWRAGMSKEATADFETGLKQFPRDAMIRLEYGTLLLERGDVAPGQRLLREAIALDGSLGEAHYQLGNAELASGHADDAVHELAAAARLDPQSAKTHFALSRAYRRAGRAPDADRERALWQRLKDNQQQVAGGRPAFGTEPN